MTSSEINLAEAKKILAEVANLTSSHCVCGHPVQAHYPLHYFMTGCQDETCDCLEFEGA